MSCSARSRPSHSRRGATLFGACSDKRGATRKQEPGSRLPFLSSLLESNVSPSVHSSRSDSQENCPEKNGQSLVSQPAKAFTNHGCIQTQTQDILGTTPSWENAHPVPSPLLGAQSRSTIGWRSANSTIAPAIFSKMRFILATLFHPDFSRQNSTVLGLHKSEDFKAQAGTTRSLHKKICGNFG